MARQWKPARASDARQTPNQPSTVTAVAQLYHAAAAALGTSLGLSVQEVLDRYHTAASAVFIECCKRDLRLPAGVKLPPLAAPVASPNGQGTGPMEAAHGRPIEPDPAHGTGDQEPHQGSEAGRPGDQGLPTVIPADGKLPCRGQEIATLKAPALAMVLSKVATLAHAEGAGWAPLLAALQAERATRVARGQRPVPPRGTAPQINQD